MEQYLKEDDLPPHLGAGVGGQLRRGGQAAPVARALGARGQQRVESLALECSGTLDKADYSLLYSRWPGPQFYKRLAWQLRGRQIPICL